MKTLLFTLILIGSMPKSWSSESHLPDMEQEILRELEKIKSQGIEWDKNIQEALLETQKPAQDNDSARAL